MKKFICLKLILTLFFVINSAQAITPEKFIKDVTSEASAILNVGKYHSLR